jgi:hypothetical protein
MLLEQDEMVRSWCNAWNEALGHTETCHSVASHPVASLWQAANNDEDLANEPPAGSWRDR